jgi:S-adenosylmethionine decarboxylase
VIHTKNYPENSVDYQPGTHIIASLSVADAGLLSGTAPVKTALDQLIEKYQLQKLGEIYHDFPGGGFTALVCLSESHISLHTWPEHQLVNMDIYLSNFMRNNDGTVNGIFESLAAFFQAEILHVQTIRR